MLVPIAIPSYRRAVSLTKLTLKFLRKSLYPAHLITVFVASEDERDLYARTIPESLYGTLVVGRPGLTAQRNFIRDFYPEGQILAQLDDDVKGIKSLEDNFLEIVERGVREIEENGCGLFGVLPTDDGRRFKNDTTYHLTHILGSFFILRNHRDIEMNFSHKEDYFRSILYFQRYGRVARYRGAGVSTTYDQGSGGLSCPDRLERMREESEQIAKLYPEFCVAIEKRGKPDLRLNWLAKKSSE